MDDQTQPVRPTPDPTEPEAAEQPVAPPPASAPAPEQPSVPPAAPTSAWVQPSDTARGPRGPLPGSLLAAGVLLIVGGVLAGLIAAVLAASGAAMESVPISSPGLSDAEIRSLRDVSRVVVIVFAGIGALVAVAHILAGIGVLRRSGWGRILGLVLSALGLLLFAFGLVGALLAKVNTLPPDAFDSSTITPAQYQQAMAIAQVVGVVLSATGLAVYLFVLVVLIRRGHEFG
jgi:hypothetical protein